MHEMKKSPPDFERLVFGRSTPPITKVGAFLRSTRFTDLLHKIPRKALLQKGSCGRKLCTDFFNRSDLNTSAKKRAKFLRYFHLILFRTFPSRYNFLFNGDENLSVSRDNFQKMQGLGIFAEISWILKFCQIFRTFPEISEIGEIVYAIFNSLIHSPP